MPATPKLSPPGRCSGSVEKACQEEGKGRQQEGQERR